MHDLHNFLYVVQAHHYYSIPYEPNYLIQCIQIMSTGDDKKNLLEKYEKMPMLELMERIPQIDWMKYFSIILQRSIDPSQNVVVYAQRYFKDLVTLIENTPPR